MSSVIHSSGQSVEEEWYEEVASDKPFEQGDFLSEFPVAPPPAELYNPEAAHLAAAEALEAEGDFVTYNVVVMTQSCDLVDPADDYQVLLCPRYDIREAEKPNGKRLGNNDDWKKLRDGRYVHMHLLAECNLEGLEFKHQEVHLDRLITVDFASIRAFSQYFPSRVRLMPPYREHLAQSFARQFMRIGLPLDLPSKYPY